MVCAKGGMVLITFEPLNIHPRRVAVAESGELGASEWVGKIGRW